MISIAIVMRLLLFKTIVQLCNQFNCVKTKAQNIPTVQYWAAPRR